ncbi:hypothetical protein ABQF53_12720 [Mycolicibacterium elephantis]
MDKLADQLSELDFVVKYRQNETSAAIENSSYGYALWQELLARHRAEVQTLADYGVTKMHRRARDFCGLEPIERDNAWAQPCETLIVASDPSYVHPLTTVYNVITAVPDIECCDIAITPNCTDRYDDELFVKHGQMLGFWHACTACISWLLEMARVEHEQRDPEDDDQEAIERKAKHFREVWSAFGHPTRNLTGFMRQPLTVPDRTGRLNRPSVDKPNLRLV